MGPRYLAMGRALPQSQRGPNLGKWHQLHQRRNGGTSPLPLLPLWVPCSAVLQPFLGVVASGFDEGELYVYTLPDRRPSSDGPGQASINGPEGSRAQGKGRSLGTQRWCVIDLFGGEIPLERRGSTADRRDKFWGGKEYNSEVFWEGYQLLCEE